MLPSTEIIYVSGNVNVGLVAHLQSGGDVVNTVARSHFRMFFIPRANI